MLFLVLDALVYYVRSRKRMARELEAADATPALAILGDASTLDLAGSLGVDL